MGCLLDIKLLQDKYVDRVKAIGFSGHHLGVAIDSAAIAMGAEWIERHFTKDRSWKGTDHAASLDADGLAKLCSDLRAVSESMTYKSEEILPLERDQRKKLKWGEYNKDQMQEAAEVSEQFESLGKATTKTVSVGGQ